MVDGFIFGVGIGFVGAGLLRFRWSMTHKTSKKTDRDTPNNFVRQYLDYGALDIHKGDYDAKYVGVSREGDDRSNTSNSWTDADREHVSELLHNKEYQSIKQAKDDVEGSVVLVSDGEMDEDYNLDEYVTRINAAKFVAAVASGEQIQSFTFNPMTKKFYWNIIITDEVSDMSEYIGESNVNDVLMESDSNANGWVQPSYYYNSRDNVYIKIETRMMASQM